MWILSALIREMIPPSGASPTQAPVPGTWDHQAVSDHPAAQGHPAEVADTNRVVSVWISSRDMRQGDASSPASWACMPTIMIESPSPNRAHRLLNFTAPTFESDVPLKRAGQPEEVAPCYVFLASQDTSYMTGQVLHPNGGTVVNG